MNTFHMSFGEITITLDNVSTLLVIHVVGKTVSRSRQDNAQTLLYRTLGVRVAEAREELRSFRGCSVRLKWLRSRFQGVTNASDPEVIKHSVRAYLLYLLGCTLFTDKTRSHVPINYLYCLEDLDSIYTYAWGATALTYLYRQLGFSNRSDVKQMARYITLIYGWVYKHFLSIVPHQKIGYQPEDPCIQHYRPCKETGVLTKNM